MESVLDWEKVKDLFALALEQPASARESFLSEVCLNDEKLREEIDSLLKAHDAPENLVEKNSLQLASLLNLHTPDHMGRRYGNYRIIREIGRGGMGSVYLAERADREFDQQVALKIVRQTLLNSQTGERFRQERQILASLNHPNIAHLLDGGISDKGEPYLIMEYVDGKPITGEAQERSLKLEEKLNLFLKICAAVSFAHRHLIIHQDLKPSNILVNREGEPKLLDFGLAEILRENIYDQPAESYFKAFTPAYASPEQIQGERVTTATDVYSLGVVLYELLTGTRPYKYESKTHEEIVRSVGMIDDPVPPSSVVSRHKNISETDYQLAPSTGELSEKIYPVSVDPKRLAGDLDSIILKALRRDPEQRYDSVESLAFDIKRHLNNLPITAHPHTFYYLISKFWLRNKISMIATAIVVFTLISGFTVALWQAQIARQQAVRAEKKFQDVRELSNSLLVDIEPKIENLPGATQARQAVVQRSLKYLDSLATESQGDSQLQAELAAAYEKVGDVQGNPQKPNLNDFIGAEKSYERASNIRLDLSSRAPSNFENRKLLANNYRNRAVLKYWIGNSEESIRTSDQALSLYSQLLSENPESTELKLAMSGASYERANFLYVNNRLEESYPYLHKPLQMLEELNSNSAPTAEIQRMIAKGYRQLAVTLSWDLRQSEAELNMEKSITLTEKLAAANPNNLLFANDLLQTYADASSIYEEVDNNVSLQYAEKALVIARNLAQDDMADVQAKISLASAHLRTAMVLEQLKEFQKEKDQLANSLRVFNELKDDDLKNQTYQTLIGTVYMHSGTAKINTGESNSAIEDFQKAAAYYQTVLDLNGESKGELRHLALVYSSIGAAYEKLSNPVLAKQNYGRSLDFYNQLTARGALTKYDQPYLESIKLKAK